MLKSWIINAEPTTCWVSGRVTMGSCTADMSCLRMASCFTVFSHHLFVKASLF